MRLSTSSLVSLICAAYPNSTEKNTANDSYSYHYSSSFYQNDYLGPQIKGNAYYQGYGKQSILATRGVKIDGTDNDWDFKIPYGSGSQAEMEESVAAIGDTTATKVVFYK